MRAVVLILPIIFFQAALAASDKDTLCAAVYAYLSEVARANGMVATGFDTASTRAQQNHLVQNPGDDQQRYAIQVIDGAQDIRERVAKGSITNDTVLSAATACNNRYFARNEYRPPQQAPDDAPTLPSIIDRARP